MQAGTLESLLNHSKIVKTKQLAECTNCFEVKPNKIVTSLYTLYMSSRAYILNRNYDCEELAVSAKEAGIAGDVFTFSVEGNCARNSVMIPSRLNICEFGDIVKYRYHSVFITTDGIVYDPRYTTEDFMYDAIEYIENMKQLNTGVELRYYKEIY
jgi:hypothetical protein